MSREQTTEVLVAGAGPVGMITAILLAESGIRVKLVDKESGTATHSYSCALHPLICDEEYGSPTGAFEHARSIWAVSMQEPM